MNYLDHDRSNFKHNKILHKMAYGLVSIQGWPLNKDENNKERQTWDCCRLAAATY